MWTCVFITVHFNILIKQDLIYIDMHEIKKKLSRLDCVGICVGRKPTWTAADAGTIQVNTGQPQTHVDRGAIIESLGDPERGHEADELHGQAEDGQDKGHSLVDGTVCEQRHLIGVRNPGSYHVRPLVITGKYKD